MSLRSAALAVIALSFMACGTASAEGRYWWRDHDGRWTSNSDASVTAASRPQGHVPRQPQHPVRRDRSNDIRWITPTKDPVAVRPSLGRRGEWMRRGNWPARFRAPRHGYRIEPPVNLVPPLR